MNNSKCNIFIKFEAISILFQLNKTQIQMIGDLFSKLQEARQKIEESKIKLNDIIVESSNNDGSIQIKANANKVITSIEISEEFMKSGSRRNSGTIVNCLK